jgi:hypothetical protein
MRGKGLSAHCVVVNVVIVSVAVAIIDKRTMVFVRKRRYMW